MQLAKECERRGGLKEGPEPGRETDDVHRWKLGAKTQDTPQCILMSDTWTDLSKPYSFFLNVIS